MPRKALAVCVTAREPSSLDKRELGFLSRIWALLGGLRGLGSRVSMVGYVEFGFLSRIWALGCRGFGFTACRV